MSILAAALAALIIVGLVISSLRGISNRRSAGSTPMARRRLADRHTAPRRRQAVIRAGARERGHCARSSRLARRGRRSSPRPSPPRPRGRAGPRDRLETTYTLVPDKGVVHVTSTSPRRTTSRTGPDDPDRDDHTATSTSRPRSPIQSEATAIRATAGRQEADDVTTGERDDGFQAVQVRFASDLFYQQIDDGPGRVRPAGRRAPVRQRHPRRGGVRRVLRLGVRRQRRRPDRHPGRLRGRDAGLRRSRSRSTTATRRCPPATRSPNRRVVRRRRRRPARRAHERAARPARRRAASSSAPGRRTRSGGPGRRPAADGLPELARPDRAATGRWTARSRSSEVHTPLLEGYAGVFYPSRTGSRSARTSTT